MQAVDFTVKKGKLWMLQTRDGKRTVQSAVRIAVDMADEGGITQGNRAERRRFREEGGRFVKVSSK